MSKLWAEGEYQITNSIYVDAVERRAGGAGIRRNEIINKCKQATNRQFDGSVLIHLGNLTAARLALGLSILPEFSPLANYPKKLAVFLENLQSKRT